MTTAEGVRERAERLLGEGRLLSGVEALEVGAAVCRRIPTCWRL